VRKICLDKGIGGPFLVLLFSMDLYSLFNLLSALPSPSNAILLESEKQLKKPDNKAIDKLLDIKLSNSV
jgi:hypothetical protein